jgi:hypothetical protein
MATDSKKNGSSNEVSKMEAERRKTLPERPQPKRPEGFGEAVPMDSDGNNPPQRMRPDVFLDAHAHVGRIEFTLDDLEAHVRLHAQVLDLLELSVGADASLGHVGLVIDDVQVDALVEVRLDAVESIVVELIHAIDNNPEIIRDLTRGVGKAVENVGEGAGEGVKKIGEGTGEGVSEIGKGAGKGVEGLGKGAGEGVKEVGEGTGKGVQGLGEGAGEGVKGAGEGVGKGVEKTGEGVGQGVKGAGEGVGKGVEKTGEGAGKAVSGDKKDSNGDGDGDGDKKSSSKRRRSRKKNKKSDNTKTKEHNLPWQT